MPQLAGSLIFCLIYPQFGTNVFFFPCPFRSHRPGYILGGRLYWWEVDWPFAVWRGRRWSCNFQFRGQMKKPEPSKIRDCPFPCDQHTDWDDCGKCFCLDSFRISAFGLCFQMYPRICLRLYHPITTVLISSPITSSLDYHSWLDTSLLWLSLPPPPISLFPAHQPVWYYSVKPHWDLITFYSRSSVTPLATHGKPELREPYRVCLLPLPCQMVLSSLCFCCCLHMLVCLPSGFCLPVTFMGKSFLTSVRN